MRDRGSMKKLFTATALLCLTFTACAPAQSVETVENSAAAVTHVAKSTTGPRAPFKSIRSDGLEELIIAGGCFWCVEADFEKVKGVQAAISGYTGGGLDSPSYKKVVTNRTGHYEAGGSFLENHRPNRCARTVLR